MLSHLSSLICVLGLLNTHTHGAEHDTGLVSSGPVVRPHLMRCHSSEMETFRCWWSTGTFSNLSEPGALALFYQMNTIPLSEWQECPEYTPSMQNECYFSREFTQIWTPYCIQLRSATHTHNITYDELCFNVEDIVHPDPPVNLNWTLLNVSRSGLNYDIMVHWAPPPSAEVETGWMRLKYEVYYRIQNTSNWDKLDLESGTQQSLYGLHTDRRYEVRVRCTMSTFKNFGDFSDSIFIYIPSNSSQDSLFPVRLLLIVGVVVLLIFLFLILFSQQQRLMVILLPPVPAPKIKGIDPELLKKGKLDELNSLLSSQHIYKPDSDPDDSWVEFIQIDLDDVLEKNEKSDKKHLLGSYFHCSAQRLVSTHKGDDDSGLEMEPDREERHPLVSRSSSTPTPVLQTESERSDGNTWMNMDFYAQVSDVTPAGGVVLTPEQQNNTLSKKDEDEKEQSKKMKEMLDIELRVTESDGGYSSENVALHLLHPDSPSNQEQDQPYHIINSDIERERQISSYMSETPPLSVIVPLPDYTVVQEVDEQHSILLNPNSTPQLPSCLQNLPKCPPNMPVEYLTPELIENISP